MNPAPLLEAFNTPEVITFEAEDHRRFAVARFNASGQVCEVFERVPLHVLDLPDEEKEWHLDQIATKLKRRVVKRRQVEAARGRGL